MERLNYEMRCSVLNLAKADKMKAISQIQYYVKAAYSTLQGDELEEFLRDVVVLENDINPH